MSNSLFDIYQNVESSKELWNSLEAKYMAEDASSKKFLVSNFINYKMTDSRPVLEQYDKLLGILGRFTQHKMNMDEAYSLGSHLRIKESLRVQDSDKPKGNNVVSPSVVNIKCGKTGYIKRDCKGVNVGNKANGSGIKGSVDGSSNSLKGQNMFNKSLQVYYVTYVSEAYFVEDDDVAWWVDSGATIHVCKDRCWFKTYESLNDGSILHMRNESTTLVHGRGYVDLRFSSGKIVSLFNVLQVPNIRNNSVSSSVLNNCGYKQVIESNKFVLCKHGVFIGLGHVHFKRMQDMSKDGLIPTFDKDTKNNLCDLHATPSLGNKKYFVTFIDDTSRVKEAIECIFVGYAEHSKAFRFYVIEPNDSVSINSIIESRDAIFDENRFSSVPRPSLKILNGTEDIGGLVVLEEVTKEVV
ncbi:hypothetical protein Tco_0122567 [Tanacetum coccineum]